MRKLGICFALAVLFVLVGCEGDIGRHTADLIITVGAKVDTVKIVDCRYSSWEGKEMFHSRKNYAYGGILYHEACRLDGLVTFMIPAEATMEVINVERHRRKISKPDYKNKAIQRPG